MRRYYPFDFGTDIEEATAEMIYDAQGDRYSEDRAPVTAAFQKGIKNREEILRRARILKRRLRTINGRMQHESILDFGRRYNI